MRNKASFLVARFGTRTFVASGLFVAAIETWKNVGGASPELPYLTAVIHVLVGVAWIACGLGIFIIGINEFSGEENESCKCEQRRGQSDS